MTTEKKFKAISAAVTATLFASLLTIGIYHRNNAELQDDILKQKEMRESLSVEKASLVRELDKLRGEMKKIQGRNVGLDNSLKEVNQKLLAAEGRVNKLMKENQQMGAVRKEQEQLKKLKAELLAKLESLQNENSFLKQENHLLSQTIAELRKENERLQLTTQQKPLMAYNFLTEALKKRHDRLTVKAKRTHLVNVSFDIQDDASLKAPYRLELRSSKGELLNGELAMLAEESFTQEVLYASTDSQAFTEAVSYKKISMRFDPEDKLKQGVYQLMVYNGNHYLGSTQFRLR